MIKAKKKLFQDKIDYYQQMVSLFEKVPEIKDLNDEEERAIDSYVEQIYHMISTPGVIIQ
ncbi:MULTISPECIES: hypothetical protein [unclassified Enterococcus]|uniref:hypothetical protein n=1 Tax=unclassified Enterococcus TaxID=2608891 RepID=UPI000A349A62|nr:MULTISPECIES: hypothetical protein [unclassified Enterococcus]